MKRSPKGNIIQSSVLRLYDIMSSSFQFVNSSCITSTEDNFNFLRMQNHPSTNSNETFYIDEKTVLRTHCSNFQKTIFQKIAQEKLYRGNYFSIGKVFRKDDSKRHSYFFHQCDAIIDNSLECSEEQSVEIYITKLISILDEFFGKKSKYRLRKSFFPFTDPSFELDMIDANGSFIEILGCGMVHKEILVGVNKSIRNVFAFGIGIERLISIKFNIDSIKEMRITFIN